MDWQLFHWINMLQQRTAWANGPLRLYAKVGIVVFPLAIVIAWWVARRQGDQRRVAAAVWAGVAPFGVFVVNQLVGHLVLRPRPYATHSGVHLLLARTGDVSFPSDHAAVAAALFLVDRRIGLVAAILALLMAFARVYVGAHYPGDVAGGMAIGVLIALAGWPLAVRVLEPLATRLARSPLRSLVSGRRARAGSALG